MRSKIDHIAAVPLKPEVAQELAALYLAKGVAATAAIEGNSLSEKDVLAQVKGELDLPKSKAYLGVETNNILEACRDIDDQIDQSPGSLSTLSVDRICHYNRRVLADLELDDERTVPGEIRSHSVVVGNVYRGAPAEDCRYLLERLVSWLNSDDLLAFRDRLGVGLDVLRATLAHLYIAWIHPFGDGNGRTARLVEFQILVGSGVPAVSAHLLSNHYNATRTEYYRQLRRASESGGDINGFLTYAAQGFVDELRTQISRVMKQLHDLAWRDLVEEMFFDETGKPAARRKELAVALFRHGEPVPRSRLMQLTPLLQYQYEDLTSKALSRDLNDLRKRALVITSGAGRWTANERLLTSLRSPRLDPTDATLQKAV